MVLSENLPVLLQLLLLLLVVVKLVAVWWGQARWTGIVWHVWRCETSRTELSVVSERRVEVQVELRCCCRLHFGG